jgi:hypothetical protein
MIGTLSQVIENLSISAVKKAILQRWAGEAGKNNAAAANDAYEALQIS